MWQLRHLAKERRAYAWGGEVAPVTASIDPAIIEVIGSGGEEGGDAG